jgi:hypothetical protein
MAVRNDDEMTDDTVGIETSQRGRYAEIRLDSGEGVIYDVDDESGWIQSGSAVSLDAMV